MGIYQHRQLHLSEISSRPQGIEDGSKADIG